MRRPNSATTLVALMLFPMIASTVIASASLAMAADSLAKEATTDDAGNTNFFIDSLRADTDVCL